MLDMRLRYLRALPHAHAQGVKQSVCPSVVVNSTKTAKSREVGIEQIVSTIKLS